VAQLSTEKAFVVRAKSFKMIGRVAHSASSLLFWSFFDGWTGLDYLFLLDLLYELPLFLEKRNYGFSFAPFFGRWESSYPLPFSGLFLSFFGAFL